MPAGRESVDTWRCEVYDLAERKFGDWHEWLQRGRAADAVPPAPMPPLGGQLYSFDPANADILTTTTTLYPADHNVLRYTPSADAYAVTISSLSGVFAQLTRSALEPPRPASFDVCFADGGRAAAGTDAESADGYAMTMGTADGLQLSATCTGSVQMSRPRAASAATARAAAAPACTVKLDSLRASGIPAGTDDLAVEISISEGGDRVSARTEAAPGGADAAWADEIAISAAGRPDSVTVELFANGSDAALATAEIAISGRDSGEIEAVLTGAGAEVTLSANFGLEFADVAASKAAAPVAPPPAEATRVVLPTGTVVVLLADGTLRVLHRNGNVGERPIDGPHAGCWVSTNASGLRVGERDDGTAFFVPAVAVASSTDPITQVMTESIRRDQHHNPPRSTKHPAEVHNPPRPRSTWSRRAMTARSCSRAPTGRSWCDSPTARRSSPTRRRRSTPIGATCASNAQAPAMHGTASSL